MTAIPSSALINTVMAEQIQKTFITTDQGLDNKSNVAEAVQQPNNVTIADDENPKTLNDSFKQIAAARQRSRDAYYTLIASGYAALAIGFIDKESVELNKNVALLDAECAKHPEINFLINDDFYKKIAMLSLGTSELTSQTYDIAHVFKVAEKLKKKVSEINEWCVENGGVQGIRRKWKSDGTLRNNAESTKSTSSRLNKLSKADAKKISDHLSKKCIGTVKATDLIDVEPPANGVAVTCTAIVTKEPDGSLSIRQIVEHEDVLAYAYAAVDAQMHA